MKFKNGQHVKLLFSANPDSMYTHHCNVEGIIVNDKKQRSLEVIPVSPLPSTYSRWWIDGKYLKLSVQKGEQLLFDFMKE